MEGNNTFATLSTNKLMKSIITENKSPAPLSVNGVIQSYPGCPPPNYDIKKCVNGKYTISLIQDKTCNSKLIEKCVINNKTLYDNTNKPTNIKNSNIMPLSTNISLSRNKKCNSFIYFDSTPSILTTCANKNLTLNMSQQDNCDIIKLENTCTDPIKKQ